MQLRDNVCCWIRFYLVHKAHRKDRPIHENGPYDLAHHFGDGGTATASTTHGRLDKELAKIDE